MLECIWQSRRRPWLTGIACSTDAGECRLNLHRDWAKYSGDRLNYAALVGLAPLPIGWLIGWWAFARKRPNREAVRSIGRGSALAPLN
jgi:hypothetical protein